MLTDVYRPETTCVNEGDWRTVWEGTNWQVAYLKQFMFIWNKLLNQCVETYKTTYKINVTVDPLRRNKLASCLFETIYVYL